MYAPSRSLLEFAEPLGVDAGCDVQLFLRPGDLYLSHDGGVPGEVCSAEFQVNSLAEKDAHTLLASYAGVPVEDLPEQAAAVAKASGFLPLALAMSGSSVRRRGNWDAVLDRFANADLSRVSGVLPNYPHRDLLAALDASVEGLEPTDRDRYLDLAVSIVQARPATAPVAAAPDRWAQPGARPGVGESG